jgi:predicted membrane protein
MLTKVAEKIKDDFALYWRTLTAYVGNSMALMPTIIIIFTAAIMVIVYAVGTDSIQTSMLFIAAIAFSFGLISLFALLFIATILFFAASFISIPFRLMWESYTESAKHNDISARLQKTLHNVGTKLSIDEVRDLLKEAEKKKK